MKAYLLQQRDAIKHANEVPWFVQHSLDRYFAAKRAGKMAHDLSGKPGFGQWGPAPSVPAEVRKRSDWCKRQSGVRGNKKPETFTRDQALKETRKLTKWMKSHGIVFASIVHRFDTDDG